MAKTTWKSFPRADSIFSKLGPTTFHPAPQPDTTGELAYWNSTDCAAFLRCTRRHFIERIKPLYSFPHARYLMRLDGTVSRPLWLDKKVQA